jgi:hypothetical protein
MPLKELLQPIERPGACPASGLKTEVIIEAYTGLFFVISP